MGNGGVNMKKHGPEWHRQRAIEKRQRERARKNYHKNRCLRDLEELEAEFSKKSNKWLADLARRL